MPDVLRHEEKSLAQVLLAFLGIHDPAHCYLALLPSPGRLAVQAGGLADFPDDLKHLVQARARRYLVRLLHALPEQLPVTRATGSAGRRTCRTT